MLCLGTSGVAGIVYWFTMDDTERGSPIVYADPDEDPHERKSEAVLDTGTAAKPEPLPVDEPEPEPEPEPRKEPEPKKQPEPRKTTGSTSGSTSGSSGSRTSGSTSTGSSSGSRTGNTTSTASTPKAPEPEPEAIVLPGASYEVKISLPSKKKATLRCGDGQSTKFSSAVRMDFKGTVTCVVEADGARGAVTVSKGGRVSCGITGEDIFCSGPS